MYQCINLKMSQFENLKMLLMYQCVNVEMSWSLQGIRHCEVTKQCLQGNKQIAEQARLKFGQVRLTVGHA